MKRLSRFSSWWFGLMIRGMRRCRPTFGQAAAGASLLALFSLVYLAGAAVMYFRLPTSVYLTKAFMGAQDWSAPPEGRSPIPVPHGVGTLALTLDRKGVACDGFTLCMTSEAPQATLRDMEGNVVHQWKMPSRMAWPRAPHVRDPLPDEHVHWDNCYVFPNGDLIALCARISDPYGYGLVKLDRNSNLLWAYSANVHHSFDVGDDGRIYVLTQRYDAEPPADFPVTLHRYIAEDLVVLSRDGQPQATIPLYEAFQNSNYSILFISQLLRSRNHAWSAGSPAQTKKAPSADDPSTGDIFHSNSVKVLPQALTTKFPLFQPGWVLLSFRSSSIIALIDPEKGNVVWAASGPWQSQHDAQFLADGHLLLFDNFGSPYGARVLEYDPVTQAIPWAYASEATPQAVRVQSRGACQRLPNGNTLFVVPERSVFEVSTNKETVWELSVPDIVLARRYAPDQLPFLPVGTSPRPK
jgi:hypothetical protein